MKGIKVSRGQGDKIDSKPVVLVKSRVGLHDLLVIFSTSLTLQKYINQGLRGQGNKNI